MWKRVFTLLILIAMPLSAGCLDDLVSPAIVPTGETGPVHPRVYTFPFEGGEETIRIGIDPAVYAGAKEADRRLHLYKDLSEEEWIPIYYQAFADDPHQEPFYADLIAAFREIRDRKGLDDDRYLELITAFVQSIPYRTDDSLTEPKFPIVTCGDGDGDCDDKSLLLAALLAREGYRASLFYFGDETHMAVGVGSAGCHYRNTSFAYIEATNTSYVGIPPAVLSQGTVLASDPLVIPIGDGPRQYTACDQIRAIERALSASRARAEALVPEIDMRAGEIEAKKEHIDSLGARITDLSGAGEIGEYNRLVPEYNRKARDYNDMLRSYNTLLDESRTAVDIYNLLITHAHDRPGSYLRARAYLEEG
ncbi:MAG: hypothetical protein GX882_04500 [Methanomicrobiales archaeon]|nr:hypothetical protein [Methanomicrobiales archaeon]